MSCTPLDIATGLFITNEDWSKDAKKPFDANSKTVELTPAGISVKQGGNLVSHQLLTNHELLYRVLGDKYLVILDVEKSVSSTDRTLSVVDFSKWTEVTVVKVTAISSNTPLPVVNRSQGNGSVFLAYGQDGTQQTSVGIYRSDNGEPLCFLGSIIASALTTGEFTASKQLRIHYSVGGVSNDKICNPPKGDCTISPASVKFPEVWWDACWIDLWTKQFSVKNSGTDCLKVNSIQPNDPFSIKETSKPLPAFLEVGEPLVVTVQFYPKKAWNWNPANLVLSTSSGNFNLPCYGKATNAPSVIEIQPNPVDFGDAGEKQVKIGNPAPGAKPLKVTIKAGGMSGFTWTGCDETLWCGYWRNIKVTFVPPEIGNFGAIVTVTSSAPGSPHKIVLKGRGPYLGATPDSTVPSPKFDQKGKQAESGAAGKSRYFPKTNRKGKRAKLGAAGKSRHSKR